MAHNRIVHCHSIVYFSLFICLTANFINSEDVPYTLLNSPSTKQDAVIVLDGHDRYKRQANVSPSPATSQGQDTTQPPTQPPSTAAPSTAAPTTAAPSTAAPSTAAPSTAAPSTAAPSTAAPTTRGGTTTTQPTTTPQYNEVKDSDTHRYYKSRIISVKEHKPPYWEELYDSSRHDALSGSHRVAVSVNVRFTFPFYGHEVTKITIATGGFLYMSPFLHQWLTATQYIAPLMANFDTKLGNDSDILYKDFSDRFVIEWRNIYLQDQNHTNPFYFQTVLHKNGTIVFSYKVVPLKVLEIESGNHPVKVGLSDAFYIDSIVSGVQRRTIYEYHRVEINSTLISENTVVILEPLTTCNIAKDCETCVTQDDEFNCKWCGKVQRCSDGIDWKRQEWRNSGCESLSHLDVDKCSSETSPSSTSPSGTSSPVPCVSGSANCSILDAQTGKKRKGSGDSGVVAGVVVVIILLLALICGIGGWFYYAYSHPQSASGQWLIEHRPSQMKAKVAKMKFWKRSTPSGEKYAVESEA